MIGVTPETAPAIEAHTKELLAALEAHFAEHAWLLGGSPSLADCSLYGTALRPLLQRCRAGEAAARDRPPDRPGRIERMNHPDPETFGPLVTGDALPPTLRALLALAAGDTVPLVLDNVRAFEEWVDTTPLLAGELPRGVGMHRTTLRGIGVDRLTLSYTLWMVQRVLDADHALGAGERGAVDATLAGTGWEPLLAYVPRHRVERRPYKLFLAGRE